MLAAWLAVSGLSPPLDRSRAQAQPDATVALAKGWNLVSLPVVPGEEDPARLFAPIAGQLEVVYAWDAVAGSWNAYSPGVPAFVNRLMAVNETMGLWVLMRQPALLHVTGGRPAFSRLTLSAGWNLVGWPGSDRSLEEAWACLDGVEAVFGYANGAWRSWRPGGPSDLGRMDTGAGYWVRMAGAATAPVAGMNTEEAAFALLGQTPLAEGRALVALACPLMPGARVVSEAFPGAPPLAFAVTVPAWFFWIDDGPDLKFVHETRYALVDMTGHAEIRTYPWRPLVEVEDGGGRLVLSALTAPLLRVAGHDLRLAALAPPAARATTKSALPAAAGRSALALEPPKKVALLYDGGDENSTLFGTSADEMSADADGMASAMGARGFDVHRVSQYWGNSHPFLHATRLANFQLEALICSFNLHPGDEFFLYIDAHASRNAFGIFNPDGSGQYYWILWSELAEILKKCVPISVNLVVMIDGCEAGGAITPLDRPGGTIITASDDEHKTPTGSGVTDNFTEDFLQSGFGSNPSKSLKDAFEFAKKEAGGDTGDYRPQWRERPHPEHCRVQYLPDWEMVHEDTRSYAVIRIAVVSDGTNEPIAGVRARLTAAKPDGTVTEVEFVTPGGRPAQGTIQVSQPGAITVTVEVLEGCQASGAAKARYQISGCPHGATSCPGPPPELL